MKSTINWPKYNPYDKRWFQESVGRAMTDERKARIRLLLTIWEPRLFKTGINVRESLLRELKRLDNLPDGVDWSMFPAWVQKARSK